MRRHRTPVGPVLIAVVAVGCSAPPPSADPATPRPVGRVTPADGGVLGLTGCASRGCHGRPATDPNGAPAPVGSANASTVWLRHDAHAGAYRTLETSAAAGIIDRLNRPGGVGWAKAHEEPRCLSCHATPALAGPAVPVSADVRRLRSEGVGCDACHTEPGRDTADWYWPHQQGWPTDGSAGGLVGCYATRGMRWLGDPASRAATCAGCHVGAPARTDLDVPVREVTHDLIAAGHPRLHFEYVTFLDLLPRHWAERSRRPDGTGSSGPPTPRPPAHDAHAWLAGQVEAATAGLGLYADRAERAARGDAVPWPELADWDCYACHHDLGPKVDGRRSPGRPTWTGGNVSDPLAQLLRDDREFVDSYRALRTAASRAGRADAVRLAAEARALRDTLARARVAVRIDEQSQHAGRELVDALELPKRHARGELERLAWDDAAQTYYALRSAARGRPDNPGVGLGRLEEMLRLPMERGVNSPVGYDPSRVSQTFAETALGWDRALRR